MNSGHFALAACQLGRADMDPKKYAKKINIDPKKAEKGLKTTRDWVLMIGAALYILSPLDLIPEAIFGVFGLVDDALVMLLAVMFYLSKYDYMKSWTKKFRKA
ncbi:hypothetical protein AXG93_1129s1110 [Marchantia polymorpha subsp. ruderalis]|uniref:DUF1232 domain-containing protein n=3 Tax=Marchantia polymorpha TaxID=3197 RepID=A0A176W2S0_MARPO|nr:hypothetical protein AXG93_1129s1110 [Marchantia polymorpha subsp. ruderalis]